MTQMPAMPVQHTGPFPPQGQPGQGPYTVQQPVVATGMPPMQQVPSPTGQPGVILVQQGTMPVQPAGQTQPAGHQYQTALPLAALTGSPAPVDCPACGQRALTVTESETGGTTQ